jgi:hypothetical protein
MADKVVRGFKIIVKPSGAIQENKKKHTEASSPFKNKLLNEKAEIFWFFMRLLFYIAYPNSTLTTI